MRQAGVARHPEDQLINGDLETEAQLRGTMLIDEPMAAHTTWRVGGPADRCYIPADIDDLARFITNRPAEEQIIWVGLGSNLLVRDGGIRGSVVMTTGILNELAVREPGVISAGAGVACAKVARFGAERGLSGAEFLVGIPGTVGGALRMNAGAFGSETWQIVRAVETIDRRGRRHGRTRAEFRAAYRSVDLPAGEWFLGAEFSLRTDPGRQSAGRIREFLARRAATQPMGMFSCGSVFKNPAGDYAGRLIDVCGLKSMRVGGARVSEKHANFIVNEGKASASDIEELIHLVQRRVRETFGILLEPEVQIVGEAHAAHGVAGDA